MAMEIGMTKRNVLEWFASLTNQFFADRGESLTPDAAGFKMSAWLSVFLPALTPSYMMPGTGI